MEDKKNEKSQENINVDNLGSEAVRIYSPTQVACGTIGGPVGLIYFLMANFDALGQDAMKNKTLKLGVGFIIALIAVLPFLPENISSTPFTIAYILIARQVAGKCQMTKTAIIESDQHIFHSNWRVLGLGLLCLIGSAIVIMVPFMLLMGILNPA